MGVLLAALVAASSVIISEVMSNPAGAGGALGPEDRNEFVELHNPGPQAVDLYDWVISDRDAADRLIAWSDSSLLWSAPNVIIGRTWLNPGGYAVILDSEYCSPYPVGGFIRPYRFADSTLILTTRNTTIGNGLSTTDPLWLVSRLGDTADTFGTPADTADRFPSDPGAGVSWERVRLDRPDSAGNWQRSRAPLGCTPGGPNSVAGLVDLALARLALDTGSGRARRCTVAVENRGAVATDDWRLDVWLDPGGEVARFPGTPVRPGATELRVLQLALDPGPAELWARLDCPLDEDTINNRRRITVSPAGPGPLELERTSLSPDRDGFEKTVAIVCRLRAGGGRLTVEVYDLRGRRVRTIHRARVSGTELRLEWDGRDDAGRLLATGAYAVRLEYDHKTSSELVRQPVLLLRGR